MVDTLERMNVQMLFAIGGDGTLKGVGAIAAEIEKRGLKISVIGIPKTIDNDISFIEKSFGFETAVTEASKITNTREKKLLSILCGIYEPDLGSFVCMNLDCEINNYVNS